MLRELCWGEILSIFAKCVFMMAHMHENQEEGLQFSSQYCLWFGELELH